MKTKFLLEFTPSEGRCRWLPYSDDGLPKLPAEEGALDDFFAAYSAASGNELLLVVNSADITIKRVEYSAEERKHILQTARYELEEQFVTDIEQLHFSYAKPGDTDLMLAAVDKRHMHAWLAPFLAEHINIVAVLPLSAAQGIDADKWTVNVSGQCLNIALDGQQSFTTSFDQARFAWDLASRETENLPSSITLYCEGDDAVHQVQDTMPAALQGLVDAQTVPWFEKTQWMQLKQSALNMLQAEFRPSVAWAKLWDFWKIPAYLCLAMLVVFGLSAYIENYRLQSENLRIRQEMVAVYQQAFPNSHVSDPEQQMRSKMGQSNTGDTASSFLPLFYQTAGALASFDSVSLSTINYDSRNDELRADLVAAQFQDIEKIRQALGEVGIVADLVSSNSVDGGERARMKFRAR